MNLVLDASVLIALFRNEPGGPALAGLLTDVANTGYCHAVNAMEIFYDFRRAAGEQRAQKVLTAIDDLGIIIREDLDRALWQDAGRLKADLIRIPFADCLCAALARRLDADVVTTDHQDFDPVAAQGLCRVRFLR